MVYDLGTTQAEAGFADFLPRLVADRTNDGVIG